MDLFYGILFSAHLGFEAKYNSLNPYIGVEFDNNIAVGAYYNSEKRLSTYIAYLTEYVELGLVTGYTTAPVHPMVKFNYNNFFITPSLEKITKPDNTREMNPGIVFGYDWRM